LGGRKGIRLVKKLSGELLAWLSANLHLLQGADCLHMAQLMPLPLTFSLASVKSKPSDTGSPG